MKIGEISSQLDLCPCNEACEVHRGEKGRCSGKNHLSRKEACKKHEVLQYIKESNGVEFIIPWTFKNKMKK